jgi:metallo-beta-lactamase family protein
VSDSFKIKFHPAGHILGSAFVEVVVKVISDKKFKNLSKTKRIVFSGDLGAPYTPILSMPQSPYQADIVVLESTYGDRIHSGRKDRRYRLLNILKKSLSDNGIIIIPAFAIGRTQELLYELNEIVEKKKLPRLPVIIDSPLANRFTALYSDLKDFWDKESRKSLKGGDDPFVFPGLVSVNNYRDHLRTLRWLNDKGGPAIVIAGSGMCTGGRVVSYLKDIRLMVHLVEI